MVLCPANRGRVLVVAAMSDCPGCNHPLEHVTYHDFVPDWGEYPCDMEARLLWCKPCDRVWITGERMDDPEWETFDPPEELVVAVDGRVPLVVPAAELVCRRQHDRPVQLLHRPPVRQP